MTHPTSCCDTSRECADSGTFQTGAHRKLPLNPWDDRLTMLNREEAGSRPARGWETAVGVRQEAGGCAGDPGPPFLSPPSGRSCSDGWRKSPIRTMPKDWVCCVLKDILGRIETKSTERSLLEACGGAKAHIDWLSANPEEMDTRNYTGIVGLDSPYYQGQPKLPADKGAHGNGKRCQQGISSRQRRQGS